jgi:hypothetical protein
LKLCPSCTVCPRDCPPPVCPDKQADRQKKISASGNSSVQKMTVVKVDRPYYLCELSVGIEVDYS